MKKLKVNCDSEGIDIAINTIHRGGVVVYPTDTVYGMGCDPYNKDAVMSIYKIKKRHDSKFFPVLGYSKNEISKIAVFNEKSEKIAEKFWPGQITLILKLKDEKIKKSLNLGEKIAVRVPDNQCVLSILKECKLLVGTSANISGTLPFTDPNECAKNISGYDVFIDGGKISSTGESTVVEIGDDLKILREGSVSKQEIIDLF